MGDQMIVLNLWPTPSIQVDFGDMINCDGNPDVVNNRRPRSRVRREKTWLWVHLWKRRVKIRLLYDHPIGPLSLSPREMRHQAPSSMFYVQCMKDEKNGSFGIGNGHQILVQGICD